MSLSSIHTIGKQYSIYVTVSFPLGYTTMHAIV